MSGVAPPSDDPGGAVAAPWDPGLQPERTALAWQRTGLALLVASLVAFRDGVAAAEPVTLLLALVAFAASVVVLRSARGELGPRLAALRAGRPLPAPTAVPAAAGAVLALAAATVAVLLR